MSPRDRSETSARLRSSDPLSACDELLASAALAQEFGKDSVSWPASGPSDRKPEFLIRAADNEWAAECRRLQDQQRVQELNQIMLQTGQPWNTSLHPFFTRTFCRRWQS